MGKIRHVVFDFDGTIANSIVPGLIIVNNFITTLGLPTLSADDFLKLRNKSYLEIIEHFKIPLWQIPSLLNKLREGMKEQIKNVETYPYIPFVLTQLNKRGYNVYILTSNSKELVSAFLEQHDIAVIDDIFSELNIFGKANAIKRFMKIQKIQKDEMIYIGDEVRDADACKKAGVPIISVTWGFNSREILEKHDPTYIVDQARQLLPIIDAHGKELSEEISSS